MSVDEARDEVENLLNSVNTNVDETIRRESLPATTNKPEIVAACIAGLGSFTMGLSFGYSSPSIIELQREGLLSNSDQASWFASFLLVGTPLGAIIGAILVEKLGRKGAIMFASLPSILGWLLIESASEYIQLYAGRFTAGVGLGIVSVAVPLYTAEISSPHLRGRLGSIHQLAIVMGVLFAFGVGLLLSWRWLAISASIFVTASVTLMMFVPESPTWLLAKYADASQATLALQWLRGGPRANINNELCELRAVSSEDHQMATLKEIINERALYRPVLVSVTILTLQQLTGINAIMFYTENIFVTAGFSHSNPGLPALIVAIIQVIVTIISSLLMDIVGRRPLLLIGGVIMAMSNAACGVYYFLSTVYAIQNIGWLSLASLVGSITGFSIGWGPVPWLIMAEILPVRAKGFGTGLANFFTSVTAFLITKEFVAIEAIIMPYGAFWVFAGFVFIGVIFAFLVVPETKGRSLYQIEAFFT